MIDTPRLSDDERRLLQDLTEEQIRLNSEAFGGQLVDEMLVNKRAWHAGFNTLDEYWCMPFARDALHPTGISGAPWVCKWSPATLAKMRPGLTWSADEAPLGEWVMTMWDVWSISLPVHRNGRMVGFRDHRGWWRAPDPLDGMPTFEYMGSSKPVGWWPLS
jgi:hypothetical protein